MHPNLTKILTFLFVFFVSYTNAQEKIWEENFLIPEKGVWGDDDSAKIHANFEEISNWTLSYENVMLENSNDYAKTVSTSKGRFECRDIHAEVTWRSEVINISEFKNVNIQLTAKETGSGKNEQTKYLKAFFKVDESEEIQFEINAESYGNWGSTLVEQNNINAEKLQIVVYLSNHYSTDKVILDEIQITGEEKNPVIIEPGDILISEVLFNPFPGGEDYVEIYNNSEKEIPTNKLYLASRDKDAEFTQIYQLSKEKFLFQTNSYLALTKDTNAVFPFYNIECANCFLQMEKFPSYNNDKDFIVLLDAEMQIIDEFNYTDKMHALLLADEEGISLERKSFDVETNNITNWHSASTHSNYGTPGYTNSQIRIEKSVAPIISFEPESFSPNSDGYNDEYKIFYELEKSGYYANIAVFDAAGRFVTYLAKNEILGTSGTISWNGDSESGQKQKLGVYIVAVELFDLFGNIHRYKDGVVLTGILE